MKTQHRLLIFIEFFLCLSCQLCRNSAFSALLLGPALHGGRRKFKEATVSIGPSCFTGAEVVNPNLHPVALSNKPRYLEHWPQQKKNRFKFSSTEWSRICSHFHFWFPLTPLASLASPPPPRLFPPHLQTAASLLSSTWNPYLALSSVIGIPCSLKSIWAVAIPGSSRKCQMRACRLSLLCAAPVMSLPCFKPFRDCAEVIR